MGCVDANQSTLAGAAALRACILRYLTLLLGAIGLKATIS